MAQQLNRLPDGSRQDLAHLIAQVAAGNEQAFDRLHAATHRKLYGVALGILRTHIGVDDVLQEAYLNIWRKAARFDADIASPIAWLATVVRNVAIDTLRKRRIEIVDAEDEMLAARSADPDPLDEITLAAQRGAAFRAIGQLAPPRRELFALAYVRGESRERLSERFGVPTSTIKTWLRRTLMMLHKQFEIDEMHPTAASAATLERI